MYIETIKQFVADPNSELRLAAIEHMLNGSKEYWYYSYEEYEEDGPDEYCYNITSYKFTYDKNVGTIKCEEFTAGASYFPIKLLMRKAENVGADSLGDVMELLNTGQLVWDFGPQYANWGDPDARTHIL